MTTFRFDFTESKDVWLEAQTDKNIDWEAADHKGISERVRFLVQRVTDHSRFDIGHFYLSPMPGCCAIVISHNAYLTPENRGSGLSNPFRDIKGFIGKELGYSLMVASTIVTDIPAFKSFLKSNYRVDETFLNPRTGNTLAFGHKVLK